MLSDKSLDGLPKRLISDTLPVLVGGVEGVGEWNRKLELDHSTAVVDDGAGVESSWRSTGQSP